MKELKKNLKLLLMEIFIGFAFKVCPKDLYKTMKWFSEQPFEITTNKKFGFEPNERLNINK